MRSTLHSSPAPLVDLRAWLAHLWSRLAQLVRTREGAIVMGTLLVGLLWRLVLVALSWPPTNSDEGFTGLMAMHIAFHGEFPIFFWGASYEGPLDSYLAAGFFRLLGTSLISMRLAIVLVGMLAIGCIYLLTRRLYSRGLALATLALLVAGTPEALSGEIFARGGYIEMLFCSTLALLLAVELARGTGDLTMEGTEGSKKLTMEDTQDTEDGRAPHKARQAATQANRATSSQLGGARLPVGTRSALGLPAPPLEREPSSTSGRRTNTLSALSVRIRTRPPLVSRAVSNARRPGVPATTSPRRLAMYAGLGLAASLGVWAQTLAVPFALAALALVVALRGRELLTRAGLCLALGLLVGAAPLLIYAVTSPDHNPLSGAFAVQQSSYSAQGARITLLVGEVVGTVVESVPIMTGGAALPPHDAPYPWPLSARAGFPQVLAYVVHGLWSLGYLALLVGALLASVRAVRIRWRARRQAKSSSADDAALARECGRLALLAGAGLTLVLYAASPVVARAPDVVDRYLLGLLIALGAILAPLWDAAHAPHARRRLLAGMALGVVTLASVANVAQTVGYLPGARTTAAHQAALVSDLERLGATRVYSEYWTCGLVTFLSREHLICAVLTEQLQPGLDRYLPYRTAVNRAADPFWVFPLNSKQAAAFAARAAALPGTYRRWQMDGYVFYQASSR